MASAYVEIPLFGERAFGRSALVDVGDYVLVSQYRWHVFEVERNGRTNGPYARTKPKGTKGLFMHTMITEFARVDHHDLNGLNNRRLNLREATIAQSNANQPNRLGSASRYKGVIWHHGKWQARVLEGGRRRSLGHFPDEEEAARAYDRAALEVQGEFAYLNFPGAPTDPGAPSPWS